MSHDGEASAPRHDPSLTDITNRKPRSISTMVWLTTPASKTRAAPCVRLARPDATAESWSARARSSRSDTAISRPSDETTIACATPGTLRTKLLTNQLRFCASLLSCVIVAPWRHRGGPVIPRPGALATVVQVVAGSHPPPALEAGAVAGEHATDFLRRAREPARRQCRRPLTGGPLGLGHHLRSEVRPPDAPR